MQRWGNLDHGTQVIVVLVALWLLVSPFLAGYVSNPAVFLALPFALIFGSIAVLGWLVSLLNWLSQKRKP